MKKFINFGIVMSLLLSLFAPFGVSAEEPQKKVGDYGVDLSIWNIGGSSTMNYSLIDFAKAKEDGCEYAILRIGFEGSKTREDTLDLAFIEYYNMARQAGMKLGIYFYALGTTYEEAVNDAQWVIKVIEDNNMYFEYPLYYDVETGPHYALSKTQMTKLCQGWCETLENAGYYGGVYGRSDILNKLSDDFKSKYGLWLRYIKSDSPYAEQYNPDVMDISNQCGLWQYTMFQRFDGIQNEDLDGNYCYIDYPKFMAENGYNNYTTELYEEMLKNEPQEETSEESQETSEVSQETSKESQESQESQSDQSQDNSQTISENQEGFPLSAKIAIGVGAIILLVIIIALVIKKKN